MTASSTLARLWYDIAMATRTDVTETLWHCFQQNYHLDHSNAAVHCSPVRYSPITFRLAEVLWDANPDLQVTDSLRAVYLDLGKYREDRGRVELDDTGAV